MECKEAQEILDLARKWNLKVLVDNRVNFPTGFIDDSPASGMAQEFFVGNPSIKHVLVYYAHQTDVWRIYQHHQDPSGILCISEVVGDVSPSDLQYPFKKLEPHNASLTNPNNATVLQRAHATQLKVMEEFRRLDLRPENIPCIAGIEGPISTCVTTKLEVDDINQMLATKSFDLFQFYENQCKTWKQPSKWIVQQGYFGAFKPLSPPGMDHMFLTDHDRFAQRGACVFGLMQRMPSVALFMEKRMYGWRDGYVEADINFDFSKRIEAFQTFGLTPSIYVEDPAKRDAIRNLK